MRANTKIQLWRRPDVELRAMHGTRCAVELFHLEGRVDVAAAPIDCLEGAAAIADDEVVTLQLDRLYPAKGDLGCRHVLDEVTHGPVPSPTSAATGNYLTSSQPLKVGQAMCTDSPEINHESAEDREPVAYSNRAPLISIETISISKIGRRSGPRVYARRLVGSQIPLAVT